MQTLPPLVHSDRIIAGHMTPSYRCHPASLVVVCGHMIKFLQIECGHFYFPFLSLPAGINCDPVSTVRRMQGKASENGREEGRNLNLQMTKWNLTTHRPVPYLKLSYEKEIHFNLLQTTELFWFSLLQ